MQEMVLYIVRLYPAYAAGDFARQQVRLLQVLALMLATPALFYGGLTFLRGASSGAPRAHARDGHAGRAGDLSAYGYSVWATVRRRPPDVFRLGRP